MTALRAFAASLILAVLLAGTACSPNTGRGAAIGAATGAGLGVVNGNGVLRTAARGAAVGAAGGFVYDQVKDLD